MRRSRSWRRRGAAGLPEPDDYRTEDYRAPVPATLAGARVLSTADAEAIWQAKSGVFIDVMPRAPKPANLPQGTVWRDKPRHNIPGSVWLPDTGYGKLAVVTEEYCEPDSFGDGGQYECAGGDVLPGGLLDVVERGEAYSNLRLLQRRLVPRRNGWLGAGRAGADGGAAGAARRRPRADANKNIENNPMHSRHVLALAALFATVSV